jgi:uncharacterized protein (DUF924 family)
MNQTTDSLANTDQTPESIIRFWFKDDATGRMDLPQPKRWFNGGKTLDQELATLFGPVLLRARQGHLAHWLESAHGTLALIILLDQFNRNIHRGTAEAFAADHQALAACEHALGMQYPLQYSLTQKVFCYLPLEHHESPDSQKKSVALFSALTTEATPDLQDFANSTLSSAREHQQIIDQFGRYPYRNAVLERASTKEEQDWLEQGNKRFGQ